MTTDTLQKQSGFSLIELMMAMLITLIISGAIYGLMSTGQGAFRREPELADRQQNIRAAMDLLQRDVEIAGSGMDPFVQAFTDGLNAVGPNRPDGTATDYLEIRGNDGLCPALKRCDTSPGDSIFTDNVLPACFNLPALVYVANSGDTDPPTPRANWGIRFAFPPAGGGAGGSCGQGHINFPHGMSTLNPPGGCGATGCNPIMKIQMERYEIWIDPADPQQIPNLWRSPMGLATATGGTQAGPPVAPWQLVARGIEDMQVQYLNGNGVWQDTPGTVTAANPAAPTTAEANSIVRQIRVTLSARNTGARNLQGASRPGAAPATQQFVRGHLTMTVSPRAALTALSQMPPPAGVMWR